MKSFLTGLALLAASQSAFADLPYPTGPTFLADNYEIWIRSNGAFEFDGTTLTKNYNVAGEHLASDGQFKSQHIDYFIISAFATDDFWVTGIEVTIKGTLSGEIAGANAGGVFNAFLDGGSITTETDFNYQVQLNASDETLPHSGAFEATSYFDIYNYLGGTAGFGTMWDFNVITEVNDANLAWTIDSISYKYIFIPAVPEPSAYALLGLGLGIVGFAAARRRKSA